jgi:hypothetical protein
MLCCLSICVCARVHMSTLIEISCVFVRNILIDTYRSGECLSRLCAIFYIYVTQYIVHEMYTAFFFEYMSTATQVSLDLRHC